MEEVWVVYLCLFLVVVVYFLMHQKTDEEIKSEKDSGPAPASSSYSTGSVGRRLECTEEELEQSLERLARVLAKDEAWKREAPPEQRESSGRGPSPPQSSVQVLGKGQQVFASQQHSLVSPWLAVLKWICQVECWGRGTDTPRIPFSRTRVIQPGEGRERGVYEVAHHR